MLMLDNPLWASLSTLHRSIAVSVGEHLRYPGDVAPFLAAADSMLDGEALRRSLAPDETLFLLGSEPRAPRGFVVESLGQLHQMISLTQDVSSDAAPIVPLGNEHRAAVLELTALVYPHYFRPRTMSLGRYFGIFENGRLAAMIGERMGAPGLREVSAVCTHPDFAGRGLARTLLAFLTDDLRRRHETPFLHVSPTNGRALALYQRTGWSTRKMISFWSLRASAE